MSGVNPHLSNNNNAVIDDDDDEDEVVIVERGSLIGNNGFPGSKSLPPTRRQSGENSELERERVLREVENGVMKEGPGSGLHHHHHHNGVGVGRQVAKDGHLLTGFLLDDDEIDADLQSESSRGFSPRVTDVVGL
jgi:hypothetical protein